MEMVVSGKDYLIVITSDHPDDSKLPLIMISDIADLSQYQGVPFEVIQLRQMVRKILQMKS